MAQKVDSARVFAKIRCRQIRASTLGPFGDVQPLYPPYRLLFPGRAQVVLRKLLKRCTSAGTASVGWMRAGVPKARAV